MFCLYPGRILSFFRCVPDPDIGLIEQEGGMEIDSMPGVEGMNYKFDIALVMGYICLKNNLLLVCVTVAVVPKSAVVEDKLLFFCGILQ